jgi:hypothetical protein
MKQNVEFPRGVGTSEKSAKKDKMGHRSQFLTEESPTRFFAGILRFPDTSHEQ